MTLKKLNTYDRIICSFSGGKDSIACFLHLLELGVDRSKIELWHNEIDGREGSELMDWKCTQDYCRKFAQAFGVPIYFSWREGGFEREMLRDNTSTAPIKFETPEGAIKSAGGIRESLGTRLKFPQVSADLSVRYCSSYAKIDVSAMAIRNQERFNGIKTLFITGERGEESKARAGYAINEPDRADNRTGAKKRHVQHWRPIRDWKRERVWDIIERFKIRTHPAYYLGFGRVSCACCIFGSKNQFATIHKINPSQTERIMNYEEKFGVTIKRDKSIRQLISEGTPYDMDAETIKMALSKEYTLPIFMNTWVRPAGAEGEQCGSM